MLGDLTSISIGSAIALCADKANRESKARTNIIL